jgi:hypothetical protein
VILNAIVTHTGLEVSCLNANDDRSDSNIAYRKVAMKLPEVLAVVEVPGGGVTDNFSVVWLL